jgi:pilus assembly protein CpaC
LIQERKSAQNRGLPFLADLPMVGAAFRSVQEEVNEIELLITVTPELVDAMDPEEVPPCGPGESTESPCDKDLYFRGFIEVPKGYGVSCEGNNCSHGKCRNGRCQDCGHGVPQGVPGQYESIEPGIRMPGMPASPSVEAPISTARRTNPHIQQGRATRQTSTGPGINNNQSPPALIGPIGYDVLR